VNSNCIRKGDLKHLCEVTMLFFLTWIRGRGEIDPQETGLVCDLFYIRPGKTGSTILREKKDSGGNQGEKKIP